MTAKSIMNSFHFSRERRLTESSQYSNVFQNPIRIGNRAFTVLAVYNDVSFARLGLAIAKKNVKLAVKRNIIKRKIRESFRTKHPDLPHFDLIFMVRRDINKMTSAEVNESLLHIWKVVFKKCKQS